MPGGKKPCRLWTRARSKAGYGQKYVGGKVRYVHRVEWEKHHGPIPPGMVVCHCCDNPACYEISHLFLGTPGDNVHDCIAKGRAVHHRRVDRDVIVSRYLAGESAKVLADEYGVHPNTVTKYARKVDPLTTKGRWGGARR